MVWGLQGLESRAGFRVQGLEVSTGPSVPAILGNDSALHKIPKPAV